MNGQDVILGSIHLLTDSLFKTADICCSLQNASREMIDLSNEMESLGGVLLAFQKACETSLPHLEDGDIKKLYYDVVVSLTESFQRFLGDTKSERDLASAFAKESSILYRIIARIRWQTSRPLMDGARTTINWISSQANIFLSSVMIQEFDIQLRQLQQTNIQVPMKLILNL